MHKWMRLTRMPFGFSYNAPVNVVFISIVLSIVCGVCLRVYILLAGVDSGQRAFFSLVGIFAFHSLGRWKASTWVFVAFFRITTTHVDESLHFPKSAFCRSFLFTLCPIHTLFDSVCVCGLAWLLLWFRSLHFFASSFLFTFFSKSHDWLKFSEGFVCLGAVKKCVNGHGSVDGISSLAVSDGWQRLTAPFIQQKKMLFLTFETIWVQKIRY